MENLDSLALKYIDNQLWVLDQRQLPLCEHWVHCRSPDEMCGIIKSLQVRGAPLIGIAAALALAHYAENGAPPAGIREAATRLMVSRPTAVNLKLAMDKLVFTNPDTNYRNIGGLAASLFREDQQLCEAMSNHGARLIDDGDNLLTHCNTGSLVTTGSGTALGVIKRAWNQGKRIHVYVDETRPLLQGARLTTWELEKAGIPYTLICDNAAAALMARKKIDKVFLGADRIALNGDVANKIGTYNVAIISRYHRIPFYVVAPCTTVDFACPGGESIPIEERAPEEVRGFAGVGGDVDTRPWAPPGANARNPAFDVTPVELISGIVLDRGYFPRNTLENNALAKLGKDAVIQRS